VSELDPKELREKIEAYFSDVSDTQLKEDLVEAGIDIYVNVEESPLEIAEIVHRHYWDLL